MKQDILRHIRKERILYMFIVLQIGLCVALVTYSLGHIDSAARAISALNRGVSQNNISLEAYPNTVYLGNLVLGADEIEYIRKMSDGKFRYALSCTTAGVVGDNLRNLYIVFSSSEDLAKDVVYLSDDVLAEFQNGMELFNPGLEFAGKNIVFMGDEYHINHMSEDIEGGNIITTIDGGYIDMENTILFATSNKSGYEKFIEANENLSSHFFIDKIALKNNGKTIWTVVRMLEKAGNGNYTIAVNDIMQEVSGYNDYSIMIPSYLGKMGVLLLCIAAAGIVGAMELLTKRRMYEQAIKISLGATTNYILLEEIIESLIIIAIGSATGFIIGVAATQMIPFDTAFQINISWTVLLTDMLIWIGLSLLSVIPIIISVWKMQPAEMLTCK